MGFGLATAQVERIVAGGQTVGVARMRITEASIPIRKGLSPERQR